MALATLRLRLVKFALAVGIAALLGHPLSPVRAQETASLDEVDFEVVPQSGHSDSVGDVFLFQDDRLAVSISFAGAPLVWEVRTGRLLRSLDGPVENIRRGAVDRLTNRLAAVDAISGEIYIWNVLTGQMEFRSRPAVEYAQNYDIKEKIGDLAFDPSGKFLVISTRDQFLIWDFESDVIEFVEPDALASRFGMRSRKAEDYRGRTYHYIEGSSDWDRARGSIGRIEIDEPGKFEVSLRGSSELVLELPFPAALAAHRSYYTLEDIERYQPYRDIKHTSSECDTGARLAVFYTSQQDDREVLQLVVWDMNHHNGPAIAYVNAFSPPPLWFDTRGGRPLDVQFSRDCGTIYLQYGEAADLVYLDTGQRIDLGREGGFGRSKFTRDGRHLIVSSFRNGGRVLFRNLLDRSGSNLEAGTFASNAFYARPTPDGRSFIFLNGERQVSQWSLQTGARQAEYKVDVLRKSLAPAPVGGLIGTPTHTAFDRDEFNNGSFTNIEYWADPASDEPTTIIVGPFRKGSKTGTISGRRVAMIKIDSMEQPNPHLEVWDYVEGTLISELDFPELLELKNPFERIELNSSGTLAMVWFEGTLRAENGERRYMRRLIVWSAESGQRVFDTEYAFDESDFDAKFVGDRDLLILDPEKIQRWSFGVGEDPRSVWLRRHHVSGGARTKGESMIVSPTHDRFLVVEDRPRVRVRFGPQQNPILFDANSGEVVGTLAGSEDQTREMKTEFSADGSRIVAADGPLMLVLDPNDGKLINEIGLPGNFLLFEMLGDGRRALISFRGNALAYWDLDTGEAIASFYEFEDGEWVTILPDGYFTASENGAKHLNLVTGQTALSVDQVFETLYRPTLVEYALSERDSDLVDEYGDRTGVGELLATGAPPDIALALPGGGMRTTRSTAASDRPDIVTEAREVELGLTIEERGGGAGQVVWRADGVAIEPLAVEQRRNGDGTIEVLATLPLKSGENVISAAVYNSRLTMLSGTASTSVRSTAPAQPPKLHVIALGVDDYASPNLRLNFAASDAQNIIAALCEAAGGNSLAISEIAARPAGAMECDLADDAGLYSEVRTYLATDEDVTREGIAALFEQAGANDAIGPEDVFVLFVAGHGVALDGRYYYLPADHPRIEGTKVERERLIREHAISQSDFEEWLRAVPAQKALLLYDTCESGAVVRSQRSLAQDGERETAVRQLARGTGRWVLTASTETTPAREGLFGRFGAFTFAVLEAIGDGDANSDGFINVTELAGNVTERLPEITEDAFGSTQIQVPTFGTPPGQGGAAFPFVGRKQVAALASDFIPRTPTHVVIVRGILGTIRGGQCAAPANDNPTELPAGSLVRVVSAEGGVAKLAREGELVGCLPESSIATLS